MALGRFMRLIFTSAAFDNVDNGDGTMNVEMASLGGVLAGTLPNPSFAADMATQAELDAHINDTTDAHAASAISVTPVGTLSATDVQAALAELDSEISGGGVDSVEVQGDTPITGAVELAEGSGVSLSSAGQVITISAAGGAGADFTYEARSSNTVLGTSDKGKVIVATAAFTQTLDDAATLGSGWWVVIKNGTTNGTTALVVDPDSAELIDGLSTITMYSGEERLVMCTGTAFQTILMAGGFYRANTAGANTFVVPTGIVSVTMEAIGGGGGGGGGGARAVSNIRQGGSAGGGGARVQRTVAASVLGAGGTSLTVTVGAKGTVGTGAPNNTSNGGSGGGGGTTTISTFLSGFGGGGGCGGTNGNSNKPGGTGAGHGAAGTTGTAATAAAGGGETVGDVVGKGGTGGGVSANGGNGRYAEWGGGAGGGTPDNGSSAGFAGGNSVHGGAGGGGGGSVNANNPGTATAGGAGGNVGLSGTGGGGSAGPAGGASPGGTGTDSLNTSGTGGGGGGGSNSGAGAAGGDGGSPGGAGGGGGGGTTTGGAGGLGGLGEARIWYS